jgi:hypothetical protein
VKGPLPAKRRLRVAADLNGGVTGLAAGPAAGGFTVTTDAHGLYVLDGDLARVQRYTVVDPGFSIDVGRLAGVAVVDPGTVMVLGHNKSFVLLETPEAAPDASANFRFFLESFQAFSELRRGRFATVRAKMNYVQSLGYDRGTDSLYTVTVPNRFHRALVISRFAREDMTLSGEHRPRLGAGLTLAGKERSLDEYFTTGISIEDGRLYAVSAAFSTLLVFDLHRQELVAAHGLEGLERPTGLAVRGSQIYVVNAGRDVLVVEDPTAERSPDDAEGPPGA